MILRNMFGGGSNGNNMFPVSGDESPVQYDINSLPQFKMFGRGGFISSSS